MHGRYSFQLPDLPGGLRPLWDPHAADEERQALVRTAGQEDPRAASPLSGRPRAAGQSRRYCPVACRVGRWCEGCSRPRSGIP